MTSQADNPTPPNPPAMQQTSPGIAAKFDEFGPVYRWLAVATAMVGSLATLLPATVINVAIPEIMGAYGIGQDQAQWLATGFLAASTITMLANAWMVHAFGVRFTFVAAIACFSIGSVGGLVAPSIDMLIFVRVFQGAAAGLITPLSMLIMFQVFPPDQRGRAMGIFSMGVVMAPALGPSLGGLIIDALSWRYIFFLELPLSFVAIAFGTLFLTERETDGPRDSFDWTGLILVSIFVTTILVGLTEGQDRGWHENFVMFCLITASVSLAAFIWWELVVDKPLLHLRLFTIKGYAPAAVVTFVFGAGLYGSTYLAPLFLQTVQGSTALSAGLLLMPAGFTMAIVFPISGAMADKVSPRRPIMIGVAIFALSCALMTNVDVNTPFLLMTIWVIIGRIGLGMVMPSIQAASLARLPLHLISQGSGANNFVRQMGGAFGINLTAIFLAERTQFFADGLTASQTADNTTTMEVLDIIAGLLANAGLPELTQSAVAYGFLGQMVYFKAYMLAFRDSFYLLTCVFLLTLIPAFLIGKDRPAPIEAIPHKSPAPTK